MHQRSQLALVLLLAAGTLLRVTPADAHGSFPDAQQVLLRADRPDQIILGTTFGLIFSEDGGRTWLFSCDHGLSAYAAPYQLAPLPSQRMFAITASAGLVYTDDDACTWQAAGGTLADVLPFGFSVDPSDGQRVYVFGAPRTNLRGGDGLYVSDDGGVTFGPPGFTTEPGGALLTVAPVPARPGTVLVAMYSADKHPVLLSSHDSGRQWDKTVDLVDSLGENPFELLWIDPTDPDRIYVRILGPAEETLGISKDGGKTFVPSVSIPGKLSGFVKLASGTILVGGTAGLTAIGYRSTDDGQTFQPWPEAPHVHGLAERDGKLFVAASNYDDGYALAESADEGRTLVPLMEFGQTRAMKSCVAAICTDSCAYYANIGLWPSAVCRPEPSPAAPGADGGDASGGSGAPSAPPEGLRGSANGGCGCTLPRADLSPSANWTALALLGSFFWITWRRSARR